MAYALVSAGTTVVGAGGGNSSPAFGATTTAGNLLILSCMGFAGTLSLSFPATPSGWSLGPQVKSSDTTSAVSQIYYKLAAGSDTAPSITGIAGNAYITKLYEFSGNAAASPLDKTATNDFTATTSPQVATCGSADVTSGQLVIACTGTRYTVANTKTLTNTINNGATTTDDDNDALSSGNHYCLGWGVTTSNASASSDSLAFTTTSIARGAITVATFLLASVASLNPPLAVHLQGVSRGASY